MLRGDDMAAPSLLSRALGETQTRKESHRQNGRGNLGIQDLGRLRRLRNSARPWRMSEGPEPLDQYLAGVPVSSASGRLTQLYLATPACIEPVCDSGGRALPRLLRRRYGTVCL